MLGEVAEFDPFRQTNFTADWRKFTPSNTARSGGTIYPIIANLPPLYGSKPN